MKMMYTYTRLRKGNKMVEIKMMEADGQVRVIRKETPIHVAPVVMVSAVAPKRKYDDLEIPAFNRKPLNKLCV